MRRADPTPTSLQDSDGVDQLGPLFFKGPGFPGALDKAHLQKHVDLLDDESEGRYSELDPAALGDDSDNATGPEDPRRDQKLGTHKPLKALEGSVPYVQPRQ